MNKSLFKQISLALFTFFIYCLWLNFKMACIFMVAIGLHEYSHLLAAKKIGLKTMGILLIPFVGGVALIDGKFKNYGQQAFVAIMGPIGGMFVTFITIAIYYLTNNLIFAEAAKWMALVNLFNLLPLSSLDGGRIMQAILSSWSRGISLLFKIISTMILIYLLFKLNVLVACFIMLLAGMEIYVEAKDYYYLKNGVEWLVSNDYLNKPKNITLLQAVQIISSYIITVFILIKILIEFKNFK